MSVDFMTQDYFQSYFESALASRLGTIPTEDEDNTNIGDLYQSVLDDAFEEALAKFQQISEGVDSFTKEEDVEEEKAEANATKEEAKEQQTKLEEFLSYLGIDTKEISSLQKELEAFKSQSINIQYYSASAVTTICGDVKAQADDLKAKAQQAKVEEEAKEKKEAEQSILDNQNKEPEIDSTVEEMEEENPFALDE